MHRILKRGFGPGRSKDYFVVLLDGDTVSGIVAGPFESERQSLTALDALKPLYFRVLSIASGHLVEQFVCEV